MAAEVRPDALEFCNGDPESPRLGGKDNGIDRARRCPADYVERIDGTLRHEFRDSFQDSNLKRAPSTTARQHKGGLFVFP